jgi:hypothetical protein
MIGNGLVVQSYIVINDGCPMAISREGNDHVTIRCGGSIGESFEIVAQLNALRALGELCQDMVKQLDSANKNVPAPQRRGVLAPVRSIQPTNDTNPAS